MHPCFVLHHLRHHLACVQKSKDCLACLKKVADQDKESKTAPNEAAAQAVGKRHHQLQLKGNIDEVAALVLPIGIQYSQAPGLCPLGDSEHCGSCRSSCRHRIMMPRGNGMQRLHSGTKKHRNKQDLLGMSLHMQHEWPNSTNRKVVPARCLMVPRTP